MPVPWNTNPLPYSINAPQLDVSGLSSLYNRVLAGEVPRSEFEAAYRAQQGNFVPGYVPGTVGAYQIPGLETIARVRPDLIMTGTDYPVPTTAYQAYEAQRTANPNLPRIQDVPIPKNAAELSGLPSWTDPYIIGPRTSMRSAGFDAFDFPGNAATASEFRSTQQPTPQWTGTSFSTRPTAEVSDYLKRVDSFDPTLLNQWAPGYDPQIATPKFLRGVADRLKSTNPEVDWESLKGSAPKLMDAIQKIVNNYEIDWNAIRSSNEPEREAIRQMRMARQAKGLPEAVSDPTSPWAMDTARVSAASEAFANRNKTENAAAPTGLGYAKTAEEKFPLPAPTPPAVSARMQDAYNRYMGFNTPAATQQPVVTPTIPVPQAISRQPQAYAPSASSIGAVASTTPQQSPVAQQSPVVQQSPVAQQPSTVNFGPQLPGQRQIYSWAGPQITLPDAITNQLPKTLIPTQGEAPTTYAPQAASTAPPSQQTFEPPKSIPIPDLNQLQSSAPSANNLFSTINGLQNRSVSTKPKTSGFYGGFY